MDIRPIDGRDKKAALSLLEAEWGGTLMVIRGEPIDVRDASAIGAFQADALIGLLTYALRNSEAELLTLNSTVSGKGIGGALIERFVEIAKAAGCTKAVVITSNDNLRALRLYQRHQFDMTRLFVGSMDRVRELKPHVPLIGEEGIPLRHEIELERAL